MRILITCRELSLRGGSQLYTRDLSLALRRSGHEPVVFAPILGEVAAEARAGGVATIRELDQLGVAPDLIHGQHHLQAMAAMLRFPAVPAIFVCHGWLPWQEAPPRFPSIRRYVAVDTLRRDRLVLEHGIAPQMVEIVENFVDLDRFARRTTPLPSQPRRALLFSNQAGQNPLSTAVGEVCAARGLELETIGLRSGRPVSHPEAMLAEFDLVFARGRSALEAMAVGAAVILCDVEGDGPLVTSEDFDRLRALNFGLGALQRPLDAGRLAAALDRYDPMDAARVCDEVRSGCGLPSAVEQILTIYEEVLAEHQPPDSGAIELAASRYLEWLGPFIERQIVTEITDAVRDATDAAARHDQRRDESHHELAEVAERLAMTTDSLRVLQRSPFFRARASLLRVGPLVRLYRRLTRPRP